MADPTRDHVVIPGAHVLPLAAPWIKEDPGKAHTYLDHIRAFKRLFSDSFDKIL